MEKAKKIEQEEAIEAVRRGEHFLPLYSDYYFEKKKKTGDNLLGVYIYALVLVLMLNVTCEFQSTFAQICFVGVIVLLFYNTVLFHKIMNWKKVLGAKLQPDGVLKQNLLGRERLIPYSVLEQEVRDGHMGYDTTGIRVGKGKNKLMFHYEIGDSTAKKHVRECYDELQKHMQEKLIPFKKKSLDLLDKKFFYDRSRKRQTISLCAEMFCLWAYAGSNGIYSTEMLVGCFIFIPWTCYSLSILFKNAVLTERTYSKLQEILVDYPGMKIGNKYAGWIRLIIMTLLLILVNYRIIFNG